jgi:hypothetical protein
MQWHRPAGGPSRQESYVTLASLAGGVPRRAGRPPTVLGSGRSARQSVKHEADPRRDGEVAEAIHPVDARESSVALVLAWAKANDQ